MGHGPGVYAARPFKRAIFKCTQSSTDPPVIAYTLINELDAANPVITYTSPGQYVVTLADAFTANKTFCRVQAVTPLEAGVVYTSSSIITLKFSDLATPTAAESGDFDLEIRVFF